MKTIKLNAVMASIFAAGALLLTVPAITNAGTGQGWDAFNSGAANEGVGERIPVSDMAYLGTSVKVTPTGGQGWDAFDSGAANEGVGERIPVSGKAYLGTSLEGVPGGDSDAFRAGIR